MGFLSGSISSDTLARWREPVVCRQRSGPTAVRSLITGLIVGAVYFVMCITQARIHPQPSHFRSRTIAMIAIGAGILVVSPLLGRLNSPVVCLMKDGIKRQCGARGEFLWSYYDEIETCEIRRERYKNLEFYVFTLKMRGKRRFSVLRQVKETAAPIQIDLGAIIHILRSKGVHVVTAGDADTGQ